MAAATPANSGKGGGLMRFTEARGVLGWRRQKLGRSGATARRAAGGGRTEQGLATYTTNFGAPVNGAGLGFRGFFPPVTTIESAGVGGGFEEVKEVEIAVLLPPVLSLLVEERRSYGGGKLEVSSGHSSVDRPHGPTFGIEFNLDSKELFERGTADGCWRQPWQGRARGGGSRGKGGHAAVVAAVRACGWPRLGCAGGCGEGLLTAAARACARQQ
uniref:Uncharacterized protein n=1 Tax=Oryza rufipogon TaxID=4529 RepID=A0A0E0NT20_ORYRU